MNYEGSCGNRLPSLMNRQSDLERDFHPVGEEDLCLPPRLTGILCKKRDLTSTGKEKESLPERDCK